MAGIIKDKEFIGASSCKLGYWQLVPIVPFVGKTDKLMNSITLLGKTSKKKINGKENDIVQKGGVSEKIKF